MKKFILIDGTGLVYRGFYALPLYLTNPQGKPINAVLGFTNILLALLQNQKPDYIAVAFDKKGKTFRHEEFKDYKATRPPAPQELYDQIPKIKEVIETFDIPLFEIEKYEADDVIATISKKIEKEKDLQLFIATGDFDIFQLVDKKVKILYPEKGFKDAKIIEEKDIKEKYGLSSSQIPDYKGLCGDSSDNIPGVYGIGEKTAVELLKKYESLEKIYEHLDEISENVRKKLEAGKESAFFSKKLTSLVDKAPIDFSLKSCRAKPIDYARIKPLFEKLGFKKLLERLAPPEVNPQESLF